MIICFLIEFSCLLNMKTNGTNINGSSFINALKVSRSSIVKKNDTNIDRYNKTGRIIVLFKLNLLLEKSRNVAKKIAPKKLLMVWCKGILIK